MAHKGCIWAMDILIPAPILNCILGVQTLNINVHFILKIIGISLKDIQMAYHFARIINFPEVQYSNQLNNSGPLELM